MATVKKAIKKAMAKKPMMKRPMMQAPPSASSPMGGGPMMKAGGKIKKAQGGDKVKKQMTAKEYLASGLPTGGNKPSVKKEMTAKEYLASGKPTKSSTNKAPEGYTKRSLGSGAVDFRPTDAAKEYLSKQKNGGKMKHGGVLSPSKNAVSKNVGNLNKAKAGAKMKMGGKCKNGC